MTKEEILSELRAVKYPPYDKDIVGFGMVKYVKAEGDFAEVRIFTGGDEKLALEIVKKASEVLHAAFAGRKFEVVLLKEDPAKAAADPSPKSQTLSTAKIKIAVASGKGGVGKSTIAVNLARAFAKIFSKDGEPRVGLMDCDIHGPSATILFGEKVFPSVTPEQKIVPPEIGGVKVISMGMLVDDEQPLLWRGPMVTGAIKQFCEDMLWGDLDIMILDLPPGTGDAVLSVVQLIPLDGAVVVTTPNSLAATTATRGAMIFKKSNVKILGVVENMAYLEMPDGSKEFIFGEGFADGAAAALDVPVIARVPIDKTLHTDEISKSSQDIFDGLAKKILELV